MNSLSTISKQTSYLTTCLISRKIHLSGADRCIFRTCIKTCSWKSNMTHVVKYEVYVDILLMVSNYLIQYRFVNANPEICKPGLNFQGMYN